MSYLPVALDSRTAKDAYVNKRVKIRKSAVVLAIGFCAATGCSANTTTSPNPSPAPAVPSASSTAGLGRTYHHPTDGYSFNPPAGWVLHPTEGQAGLSALFGAPVVDNSGQKPFVSNINVVVAQTSDPLEGLVSQTKEAYPNSLDNYKVVIDSPTVANGLAAHFLGGTYDIPGTGQMQNIQLMLVSASKLYTVTFTSTAKSFNENRALAEASLLSLTLN